MGKQFESVLILMVAICTVLTTGITLHDASQGRSNPIIHTARQEWQSVVSWFGSHAQTGLHGSVKSRNTVQSDGLPPEVSKTVKKLEESVFGSNALLPTVGAVLP